MYLVHDDTLNHYDLQYHVSTSFDVITPFNNSVISKPNRKQKNHKHSQCDERVTCRTQHEFY